MLFQNISYLLRYYLIEYWDDVQDPRTKNFFFVGGLPYPLLAIMGLFLYFAHSLGPRLMANRPPFDSLKPLITVYNFSMAAINVYFVYHIALNIDYGRRFLVWKFPDQDEISSKTMWELNLFWWCWMTKFLDLFDTIFFVLRKKFNHLSFLHLYHHTVVPILGYFCLKFAPNSPGLVLFGLLNGLVHVSMYTYFGLSSLGPKMQLYLWWKRYLTQLQLGQFLIFAFYVVVLTFKQTGYPLFYLWLINIQPFLFLHLFYCFYKRTYSSKSEKTAQHLQ